jgi:peroxiredoxin Q/BCP
MGISRDSLSSHKKFRDKQELNFLLLSDEEGKVHEQFKVIVPKKMYGKEYMGTERSTFIFNRDGQMVKEYRKVKSAGHAEEVLDYIKENMK